MTTTPESESVEQLAEELATDTRMANGPFKSRKLAAMEMLTKHFQKAPTPPPADAHRERVRKALAELRAEAARLRREGDTEDTSLAYVTTPNNDEKCCMTDDGWQVLCAEEKRLDLPYGKWSVAHDAIARANGLETLAELEAGECIKTFDCNAGDHSDACPVKVTPPPPQPEVVVGERDREPPAADEEDRT